MNDKMSMLVFPTPKSCLECDLATYDSIDKKYKCVKGFSVGEYFNDNTIHPQCPLQDTTELLEALNYMYEWYINNYGDYADVYFEEAHHHIHKALGGK